MVGMKDVHPTATRVRRVTRPAMTFGRLYGHDRALVPSTLIRTPQHSMTVEQLAERWQIHPKTIHRQVRAETFPILPLLPGARALRFATHAVEAHEEATGLPTRAPR